MNVSLISTEIENQLVRKLSNYQRKTFQRGRQKLCYKTPETFIKAILAAMSIEDGEEDIQIQINSDILDATLSGISSQI